MLKANKKQVPLKNYSLKIRINSYFQRIALKANLLLQLILSIKSWGTKKNLHKPVIQIYWPELQTWRFRVHIHVYQIIKNWGPGPYDSLRHADNRKYFLDPSLIWDPREVHMFHLTREKGKIRKFSYWQKGNSWSWLVNSTMVNPEKFDHPHLVYHFTVPS